MNWVPTKPVMKRTSKGIALTGPDMSGKVVGKKVPFQCCRNEKPKSQMKTVVDRMDNVFDDFEFED